MSKKEGILNITSLPTSTRGTFSMKMSSVRSNMMPMNNMKLKKMNPKIKALLISFRI
jgi:phage-related protein